MNDPAHRLRKSHFFAENSLAIGVIAAAAVALSCGWRLFAGRSLDRSERARTASLDVARIWGGPIAQPQPEVRWRRADAATVELESGELASTDVAVDLAVDYRRRGITEYPGYEAAFSGDYQFKNPAPDPAFVAFTVGLPVDRSALMLRDLRLLVDGQEDPKHTEYAPDRIAWRGRIEGARTARFTLAYRARGLGRFGYRFVADRAADGSVNTRPVTAFKLALTVHNLKGELDFPVGSMAPTAMQSSGATRVLTWDVERLLTSFDVGVVLPDRGDVAVALGHLIQNAPFFYLLYAAGLLFALSTVGRRPRALHIAGFSAAYFLYFPLATYLSAYLAWPIASSLALAGISALVIAHAHRFVGARVAGQVALVQAFFLATPAIAYLLPMHTGLILVIAGFIALGSGLHFVGRLALRLDGDEDEPQIAPPVIEPPKAEVEA
ncbi:MAG TPA: hypothetical protein VFF06_07655 [Polyangia bacterium]|nr:hypothetical protein [Polyangia bacterium]